MLMKKPNMESSVKAINEVSLHHLQKLVNRESGTSYSHGAKGYRNMFKHGLAIAGKRKTAAFERFQYADIRPLFAALVKWAALTTTTTLPHPTLSLIKERRRTNLRRPPSPPLR